MIKIDVKSFLNYLAKSADIPANQVSSGVKNTYQGSKCWKYVFGQDKFGGPVDCSGLITAIARINNPIYNRLTSASLESACVGSISTMPEKPGIFLWRKGHVGIYTGNGYTIEAFDETYNVGRRGNRVPSFTKWGYLDFVQY